MSNKKGFKGVHWSIRTDSGHVYPIQVIKEINSFFSYTFGVVKCDKPITREVVRKKLEELENLKK